MRATVEVFPGIESDYFSLDKSRFLIPSIHYRYNRYYRLKMKIFKI